MRSIDLNGTQTSHVHSLDKLVLWQYMSTIKCPSSVIITAVIAGRIVEHGFASYLQGKNK